MICSLVVHCDPENHRVARSMQALEQRPELEIGKRIDNRFALVMSTQNPAEAKRLTEWIAEQAGFTFVDVAYVHFEDS